MLGLLMGCISHKGVFMPTKLFVFFMFLCLLLTGCIAELPDPSGSSGQPDTTASQPIQNTAPTSPSVTEPARLEDIPLSVTTLSLSDLLQANDSSIIMLTSQNSRNFIYQIYVEYSKQGLADIETGYIVFYETGELSVDFANGESVNVIQAYKNQINPANYNLINSRFHGLEPVYDPDEINSHWPNGDFSILLHTELSQYFVLSNAECGQSHTDVSSQDQGIQAFIYLLHADRGCIKQYD